MQNNNIEIIDTNIKENDKKIKEKIVDKDITVKKQSFLTIILNYKPILYFFIFLVCFIIFVLSKNYIFSILSNNDQNAIVHKDKTSIFLSNIGFDSNIKLEKKKATKVIVEQLTILENYKDKQEQQFSIELQAILDNEFQSSFNNVEIYADWFYGYTTQYKILYQAGKGIVNNYRAGFSDFKIQDAANKQVTDYISKKYKDLVLKPHLLEPSLKLKLENLIQTYVDNKNKYIRKINDGFKIYLSQNPDNLSNVVLNEIKADWKSNISNSRNLLTLKDKSAEGALAVGTISILGSKITSGTAGKAMASKIIAKFGFKKAIASMSVKVATAPFTLGLSLVIGFLVDSTLNEMDEALTRDSFIDDVNQNLNNMKDTIYFEINKQHIIQTMYNQDINLYKDFVNDGNS